MENKEHHLEVEWDPAKQQKVLSERGIDFRGAVRIFAGPVLESSRLCNGELRWLAIGVVDGVELAVVYVDRGGRRRIITARRASPTVYPQVGLDKLFSAMYMSLHAGSEPDTRHASWAGAGASWRRFAAGSRGWPDRDCGGRFVKRLAFAMGWAGLNCRAA